MKYVIANLKMNFVSTEECDHYLSVLDREWQKKDRGSNTGLIICPSTLYLERFAKNLPQGAVLGGQDVFWEVRGSYTGETSSLALKNIGVQAVILGHSERRAYLGETDEMIAHKVDAALRSGLTVVLCVGETAEERKSGEMAQRIVEQIESALRSVSLMQLKHIVIAYEPRWSIGTDTTPTAHEIMQVRVLIKKILTEKYGSEEVKKVAILYGGSVKASLMREVCIDPGMDGVLVGRESLVPHELMNIFDTLT